MVKSNDRSTMLHDAAARGYTKTVSLLVNTLGADPAARDNCGVETKRERMKKLNCLSIQREGKL